MKKKLPVLIALMAMVCLSSVNAQMNVGSTSAPNVDAMLQVSGTSKGFLLPKVALTATTAAAPLSAHVAGMNVYNTATVGDVTPGYYFNNGTVWIRLGGGSSSWQRTGNAGTGAPTATGTAVGASNFWGTTDVQNLAVGTNGITRAILIPAAACTAARARTMPPFIPSTALFGAPAISTPQKMPLFLAQATMLVRVSAAMCKGTAVQWWAVATMGSPASATTAS